METEMSSKLVTSRQAAVLLSEIKCVLIKIITNRLLGKCNRLDGDGQAENNWVKLMGGKIPTFAHINTAEIFSHSSY